MLPRSIKLAHAAALIVVLLLIAPNLVRAVPPLLHIQGYLTSPSGSPEQGTRDITIALYADPQGGSPLWSEAHLDVPVVGGVYALVLGSVNPLPSSVFSGLVVWIDTTVEGDVLSPRRPIVSVPYALRAGVADSALAAPTGAASPWGTNGADVYRTGGNVGIGTAAPQRPLHLEAGNGPGTTPLLRLSRGAEYGMTELRQHYGTAQDAGLRIATGAGLDALTVLNGSGNVGIGTTSPDMRLTVAGPTRASAFHTDVAPLGNGGASLHLSPGSLTFAADFGYGVADQSLEFQSNYNAAVGGQGTLGRITGYRSPAGFDTGEGNLRFSVRNGAGLQDLVLMNPGVLKVQGDLCVTGAKNAVVPTSQGMTRVYSEESTEVWFTEYGHGRLVHGACQIELPPLFLETVTISVAHPLLVFLQAEGECRGLIAIPGLTSFQVKEAQGGTSSIAFSFRAVAKRKGFEADRLVPLEAE